MSMMPYFFENGYVPYPYRRMMNQPFGMTPPGNVAVSVLRHLPRRHTETESIARDLGTSIKSDKGMFQINLDVQHFSPEEITVKTSNGFIVVEGKHEERTDRHGQVSRQFVRRYALPEGACPETVQSKLSSDGVLIITVPTKVPMTDKNERAVPIQQTGPVRKEIIKDSE